MHELISLLFLIKIDVIEYVLPMAMNTFINSKFSLKYQNVYVLWKNSNIYITMTNDADVNSLSLVFKFDLSFPR